MNAREFLIPMWAVGCFGCIALGHFMAPQLHEDAWILELLFTLAWTVGILVPTFKE